MLLNSELALSRFDQARQGALYAAGPVLYFTDASAVSQAADSSGAFSVVYGRQTSAWVTFGDLVGKDAADQMLRPALLKQKKRLESML